MKPLCKIPLKLAGSFGADPKRQIQRAGSDQGSCKQDHADQPPPGFKIYTGRYNNYTQYDPDPPVRNSYIFLHD
jgi:hypothetical protein